jgi:hypothetical protein
VHQALLAAALILGSAAAQDKTPPTAQDIPYKFSTTVTGEPLYTFGTTVAVSGGFRGDNLCVPVQFFDEGFPGVTDRSAAKLKTGVHRIRVSYFQGPRYQVALVKPGRKK